MQQATLRLHALRGGYGQRGSPIPARNCHPPLSGAPPFDVGFTNDINGAQLASGGLSNYGTRPPPVVAGRNSSNAVAVAAVPRFGPGVTLRQTGPNPAEPVPNRPGQ